VLRIASSIEPRERLKIVMEQLAGIGGGRSLGSAPTVCAHCRMGLPKPWTNISSSSIGKRKKTLSHCQANRCLSWKIKNQFGRLESFAPNAVRRP
jgi:hypothetical protein